MLERARADRRERLAKVLADWSVADLEGLGRLMEYFNDSMSRLWDY